MKDLIIRLAPSGALEVEIPSVLAEGRSHSVEVPFSLGGLSILKKVLKDRQRTESIPTIGTMGSPVASQINEFLVRKTREDQAAAKKTAENLLTQMGLDDIELEL